MSNVLSLHGGNSMTWGYWGTYGPGGYEHCQGRCPLHQLVWKKLEDLETDHLKQIIRTQRQLIGHEYTKMINKILVSRGEKKARFNITAAYKLYKGAALAL